MNQEIKIPKGWRKLKKGNLVRHGDKVIWKDEPRLIERTLNGETNFRVGDGDSLKTRIYIRRIKRKKSTK